MKKYLAQLRPVERRLVVGVGVALVVVLNWAFIWPHLSDWGKYERRRTSADAKLKQYQTAAAQIPDLQKQLGKYESEGVFVAVEDQGITLMKMIQEQMIQSGVALQNFSKPTTRTNDVFFVEQIQNINVIAPEEQLVDFLYKLGSDDTSMIRIRDLTLQPDPPHMRLSADIKLVASYQKNPAGAAKTSTAKAK